MSSNQRILKTVTVAENKGCVHILSFGSAPFALAKKHVKSILEPRAHTLIPNGFKVRTKCSARDWELETRVLGEGGIVEYMCICVEHPTVCGGWQRTASNAYVETNLALIALGLGNGKFRAKENGALLIGITYPNVQRELYAYFKAARERAAPMEPLTTPKVEILSHGVADCPPKAEMSQNALGALTLEEAPQHKIAGPDFDFLDTILSQSNDVLADYLFNPFISEPCDWE